MNDSDVAPPQPELDDELDELIHRVDLDGLVRLIDNRTSSRDWAGILRARDRARAAVATGRQLWPVATLAEYRLALLGPNELAAVVLDESDALAGRFSIGPLPEVVAQHHRWDELAPLLSPGPRTSLVAHERLLRGDTIDHEAAQLIEVFDIPIELFDWEPTYPVAVYHDDRVESLPPSLPTPTNDLDLPSEPTNALDDDFVDTVRLAFEQLVEPWLHGSNGAATVVATDGGIEAAIRACGVTRARSVEISGREALALLAWAGANGGAHGRRRGAAAGRFGAWWLLGALGDLLDDWLPDPDELAEVAAELIWHRWDAFEPELGWTVRLAIHDPVEERSWVLSAQDAV